MTDIIEDNSAPPTGAGTAKGSLPLIIPEGIAYNCQGCGRCCSGWAVGLTEKDWQKVKETDWQSLHPDLAERELFVHREREFADGTSRYPHYTRAREDGTCSFLINNLCFIHSTLGEEMKPGMCKLFPYSFVPTPGGIYVGLAYNSNAAVRNMGRMLSDQREMLEQMWHVNIAQEMALTKAADAALERIASLEGAVSAAVEFHAGLASGLPITWDQYLIVEDRLMKLIQQERPANFCHLLLAGEEIICEAIRLKRTGGELSSLASFTVDVSRWLGSTPTLFENWLFNVLCFRNFVWPEFRKKHKELWAGGEKNPLTDPKILNSAVSTVFFKTMTLPGVGKIHLDKVLKTPVKAFTPEIYDFFHRYVFLRVFSKTYFGPALSGLSLLAGYNNLIANFLCAIVFAKAHATARGESEIRIADLYEAYFLLDKELVALSQLPGERAAFYDIGFSSPRLFNRVLGMVAATIESA